jgi:hypothetical protein
VTRGDNCDADGWGFTHRGNKPYASHAPSDGPEADSDSYAILQEAIVRKYSISIRNLLTASAST